LSARRALGLLALALALAVGLAGSPAFARPGAGFSFDPADSAAPASTAAPRPRPATPPKSSARPSEPWSARPPYAAPWAKDRTAPAGPRDRRAALARTSPKVERAHGGLVEYYFFVVAGAAGLVLALFVVTRRAARERGYEVGSLAPKRAPGGGAGR
jgi:hypothetical protein